MRAELSPRQRIYLLWTFRNFRQLSIALLNQRQRTLVIDLFRNNAGIVAPPDNPAPVIGVVENFVPPTVPPTMPQTVPSPVSSSASFDAPPVQRLAQTPVKMPVEIPFEEMDRPEKVITRRAEVAPVSDPVPSSSFAPLPIFAWAKLATSRLTTSRLTTSRLATAAGALSVCIISVVAWQRVQGIPSSQANNQPLIQQTQLEHIRPQQLQQSKANSLPDSPDAAKPASPIAIAPPTAATQPIAAPGVTVMAASIAPVISSSASSSVSTSVSSSASTRISTPASAAIPTPHRAVRVHRTASTPNFPISGQDSRIQASRPPLRFAYPNDVHARGVVALTAGLDPDGAVRTVKIISGNPALAAAAVRAVRHWRYRPYLKDGQPVATETNIVISFFSNDAISMTFPPSIPANH